MISKCTEQFDLKCECEKINKQVHKSDMSKSGAKVQNRVVARNDKSNELKRTETNTSEQK